MADQRMQIRSHDRNMASLGSCFARPLISGPEILDPMERSAFVRPVSRSFPATRWVIFVIENTAD
jgi:hypothetical protein